MEVSRQRITVLARHLVPVSEEEQGGGAALDHQGCAAVDTLLFARPAAPNVRYGRPAAAEAPSNSDLEAVGRAVGALSAASMAGGAGASAIAATSAQESMLAAGPSMPVGADDSSEDLPRFARAVVPRQLGTSPFASPLPFPAGGSSGSAPTAAALPPSPVPAPFSGVPTAPGASSDDGPWRPEMNVFETESGWAVEVALPGVRPGDVQVELAGRLLTISGNRQASASSSPTAAGAGGGLLPDLVALLPAVFGLPGASRPAQEGMAAGAFAARWLLPEEANADSLQALFRDGVLQIRVSKKGVNTLF